MADNSALRAEASNPTTDPARLAAIAHEDPSLGATVAANPGAYDGLLDWLLQYGDDDAKRAVGVRRGTIAAPAPVVAPVAPVGYAAAPTVKPPMSPGLKKGLLFGGIGLAALAVVAVAAVVLVNVVGGGGSSASGIRVQEIGSEPRDDAWGILSPMVEEGDADDDWLLGASARTVAQDRALVRWSALDSVNPDDDGDGLLSLIDTTNGSVKWTVDWDDHFTVISAPGANPYLLSVSEDDGYVVYSIDPGSGDVISDTKGLDNAGVYSVNAFGQQIGGLGGDVIIRSEDGIGRYSPKDFDEEKWFIDLDEDELPSVAGNRVIVGDTAYSIENGEEVDWDADDDLQFLDVDGKIIGAEGDSSDDTTFSLYNDAGEEQWSYDTDGSRFEYVSGGLLLLANSEDETLIALNLETGEEEWTADLDEGFHIAGAAEDAGILVFTSTDDAEAVVIDRQSGDEISSFDTDDFSSVMLGVSKNFIYMSGNDDGDLVAIETGSGDEAWSLDNPGEYSYYLLGGSIVGIAQLEFDDAEDDPVIIGIQP